MTPARISRATALATPLLLVSLAAGAVEIEPAITLGEIYTSNVDLQPDGLEESEWVTRVAPQIAIDYQGAGLVASLDYTLEALFYAEDSDRNEAYNQLSSSALLDLLGDDLRLRAAAVIDQVNIEPERPVSNSNINTTGNRTDAMSWNIGPEWSRKVLGNSEVDGFAVVGKVDFDEPTSQDVDTVGGRFSLHTDPRSRSVGRYELAYEYDQLDYEISGETVVQTAYLQLGYRVNDSLEFFGLGGLDNDIEDPSDTTLSEGRWELGVATEFGANRIRAAFGHRYFGPTYAFSWDIKGNESSYRLSYSEAPSTSDLTALEELPTDPTIVEPEPPPPDSDLGRPGNPTRFVISRADADATWSLYRSQIYVNVFWEQREDQVLVSEDQSAVTNFDTEESYGTNLGFSWEVGPKSLALFNASWRHREYNDLNAPGCDITVPGTCTSIGDDDTLTTLEAGLDHTLGPKTGVGFRLGLQRRADTSTGVSDYDEFWGSVQLVRTF